MSIRDKDEPATLGAAKIRDKVLSVVARETGQFASPETSFDELGLDSLDTLDLLLKISGTCNVEFPERKFTSIDTIGDLIEIYENHVSA